MRDLKSGKQRDKDGDEEDDDIPEDVKDDPFFAEALAVEKKAEGGKKKKNKPSKEERAEREKSKAELELLLMDGGEGEQKKVYSLGSSFISRPLSDL